MPANQAWASASWPFACTAAAVLVRDRSGHGQRARAASTGSGHGQRARAAGSGHGQRARAAGTGSGHGQRARAASTGSGQRGGMLSRNSAVSPKIWRFSAVLAVIVAIRPHLSHFRDSGHFRQHFGPFLAGRQAVVSRGGTGSAIPPVQLIKPLRPVQLIKAVRPVQLSRFSYPLDRARIFFPPVQLFNA